MGRSPYYKLFISLLLLLTFLNPPTWGQNDGDLPSGEDSQLPGLELPDLWMVSLQTLFWLLVVVSLIFISVWFMKKLMLPGKQFNSRKPIRLLFQETIGSGRLVCLVQVLDQIHVIGVTNTQISYLSTLEEHEMDMVNQLLENNFLLEHRLKNGFQSFFQNLSRKTGR